MSTTVRTPAPPAVRTDPAYQAFLLLRTAFTVAPIVFGLDKFVGALTDWEQYLAPQVNDLIPGTAHQAMLAVGVVEVVAGIIGNLLLLQDYYDIVLRDVGLLLGALALARLATVVPRRPGRSA